MQRENSKRIGSYVLIAAGAVLLFLGARELIESYWGQRAAARSFEAEAAAPVLPAGMPQQPRRGDTIGKLTIPRLGAAYYVMEGDQDEELRRGPGHLHGSALPGADGNCVIAGHRDTHFRMLKDIRRGDDIVIETKTGQFLYRVQNVRVIAADNLEPLRATSRAELNLITCFPFYYVGNAPKRYVVEAGLAAKTNISD